MISSRKEMPNVETKVSTVVVVHRLVRETWTDLGLSSDQGLHNGVQLLPDGTKTEVQNKKTVKVRSKDTPILSR